MSKWMTAGTIGFLLGMRCRECGRKLNAKQLRKKMVKMLGL